jgi:hypothetical protein
MQGSKEGLKGSLSQSKHKKEHKKPKSENSVTHKLSPSKADVDKSGEVPMEVAQSTPKKTQKEAEQRVEGESSVVGSRDAR